MLDRMLKYDTALNNIESDDLVFIEDVCASIGISKETFYRWWPTDSEEYATIWKLLDQNKIKEKQALRKMFAHKKSSPAEKLALYKLLGTKEDRMKLSSRAVDITSGGDKLPQLKSLDVSKLPTDLLTQILEFQNGENKDQS